VRTEHWRVGVLASYWGSAHQDLEEFDSNFPAISGWIDRLIDDETTARLRYDYTYGWVDYDPFASAHGLTASLFHGWDRAGATELFLGGGASDFFFDIEDVPDAEGTPPMCPTGVAVCGPAGLDESVVRNRDGGLLRTGIQHAYDLGRFGTSVDGGYAYQRYWSEGTEWDYQAHSLRLGAHTLLPLELILNLEGSFIYQPFDNPSTYPNAIPPGGGPYTLSTDPRLDRIWRVGVSLERQLMNHISVSARYEYSNVISNVRVYDYDRSIIGAYVKVALP
jgi:hypothetical protein